MRVRAPARAVSAAMAGRSPGREAGPAVTAVLSHAASKIIARSALQHNRAAPSRRGGGIAGWIGFRSKRMSKHVHAVLLCDLGRGRARDYFHVQGDRAASENRRPVVRRVNGILRVPGCCRSCQRRPVTGSHRRRLHCLPIACRPGSPIDIAVGLTAPACIIAGGEAAQRAVAAARPCRTRRRIARRQSYPKPGNAIRLGSYALSRPSPGVVFSDAPVARIAAVMLALVAAPPAWAQGPPRGPMQPLIVCVNIPRQSRGL